MGVTPAGASCSYSDSGNEAVPELDIGTPTLEGAVVVAACGGELVGEGQGPTPVQRQPLTFFRARLSDTLNRRSKAIQFSEALQVPPVKSKNRM